MGFFNTFKSFAKGFRVTGKYLAAGAAGRAECITSDYDASPASIDEVKRFLPERYRGHLHNNADECITCMQCSRVCPVDCILVAGEKIAPETLKSGKNRLIRPAVFEIDLGKCIYCGLCALACPTGGLSMTRGFEGSTEKFWDRKAVKEGAQRGQWGGKDSAGEFKTVSGQGMLVHYGYGWMTPEERASEDAKIAEHKRLAAEKAEAAKKAAAAKAAQPADAAPPSPAAGG
jgi:formate hydrogenlyase subunit 6/NADH:ubiquinone oxidoreductase subunit I